MQKGQCVYVNSLVHVHSPLSNRKHRLWLEEFFSSRNVLYMTSNSHASVQPRSQAPIPLYYAKQKKMVVKSGNEGTVSLDKFFTAECKVQCVFFKTASCMYMHVVM